MRNVLLRLVKKKRVVAIGTLDRIEIEKAM